MLTRRQLGYASSEAFDFHSLEFLFGGLSNCFNAIFKIPEASDK